MTEAKGDPQELGLRRESNELRAVLAAALDIWFTSSAHQSSMRQAARHPVFGLLAAAPSTATELIVARLRADSNPLWVWALGELTGDDPAVGSDSICEASRAWIEWADTRGLARHESV